MSSSPPSKLINVSDDAEVRIIRMLAGGNADAALLDWQEGRMAALLSKLPLQNVPNIPSLEDAQTTVLLASKWMDETPSSTHLQYVQRLAKVWKSSLPLSLTLYNVRTDPVERLHVLLHNLLPHEQSMTTNSPVGDLLLKESSFNELLDAASADAATRRLAYQTAATALARASENQQVIQIGPEHAQSYWIQLIQSYTDGEPVDAMAIAAARQASIHAIRDPMTLFRKQRNMLQYSAVQALKQEDPSLYAMLEVVQTGNINDYEACLKRHGLPSGISADDVRQHMRTLTLCSLASSTPGNELGYDDIAKALGSSSSADDGTIESWVIAAVSSGLLQAKMDQMRRSVTVERCAVRGPCDWKSLQRQLTSWKQHVGAILSSYQAAQAKLVSVAE